MITLRYHFLTITAIFLSLGLGIILGGSIGQHWIYEKQQALIVGLEKKYDKALQSNEELKNQLHELTMRIDETNREFSTFVSNDYLPDLQGQQIGIWKQEGMDAKQLIDLFTSVGMEIVEMDQLRAENSVTYPVVFIGDQIPEWATLLPKDAQIHITGYQTPTKQWELLRNIQKLYKSSAGQL
ncbi:copper transporter [Ammoniphilus resinae]|uniref:Copper transporter n=1 Tax=Ammoniphilus resinae TaxID=861532 RepID=A0ABS4GTF6_9BACL|nr:copper transporter [Ammoniphilus resinae]MBP1933555.1 hypothetical protein [Ammoniphilus resinae]